MACEPEDIHRDRARRIDLSGGFYEEVEFYGGSERMFTCRHVPRGSVIGGLLICSPICADFMANYHREVAVARALAASGVAVQRFHHRGTGNSDGDPASVTFEGLCEDALGAAKSLRQAVSVGTLALMGTRWGALTAAAISGSFPGAPMVLWEPTIDPNQYFQEAFRSRLIRNATQGQPNGGFASFAQELRGQGVVDLLGYPIYPALYESAPHRALPELLGDQARAILVVQMRYTNDVPPALRALTTALTGVGCDVTTYMAGVAESWWFHTDDALPSGSLVTKTVSWLSQELARQVMS